MNIAVLQADLEDGKIDARNMIAGEFAREQLIDQRLYSETD